MKNVAKLTSLQGEFIVYVFPPVLIAFFYLLFHFLRVITNDKEAYLMGMIFYWLIGCLLPAFLLISRTSKKLLLRVKKINWWQIVLILLPVLLVMFFGPFRQRIHEATILIIVLTLPYAFVNAFCEEFLWRGVFYVHHQLNFFHAVIVPSIWFGIWHYVPLSIHPASVGNFYSVLSAVGLGLCWGTVTYYTRSIFWNIISHAMVDFSGIGVMLYFNNFFR